MRRVSDEFSAPNGSQGLRQLLGRIDSLFREFGGDRDNSADLGGIEFLRLEVGRREISRGGEKACEFVLRHPCIEQGADHFARRNEILVGILSRGEIVPEEIFQIPFEIRDIYATTRSTRSSASSFGSSGRSSSSGSLRFTLFVASFG